jgi:hypothetical protein
MMGQRRSCWRQIAMSAAVLVGLASADVHDRTLGPELEIRDVEAHELAAAEAAGEAKEQDRAIARGEQRPVERPIGELREVLGQERLLLHRRDRALVRPFEPQLDDGRRRSMHPRPLGLRFTQVNRQAEVLALACARAQTAV